MGRTTKPKAPEPPLEPLDPEDVARLIAQACDPKSRPKDVMEASAILAHYGIEWQLPPEMQPDPAAAHSASTSSPLSQGNPRRTGPVCGNPVLARLSDVEAEDVEWLWPGRIPVGMLTLIFGDGGVGKSQLSLALARHITRGVPWPDAPKEAVKKGKVILVQCEDSLTHTVRPRVDAAGCDPSRVIALTGVKRHDTEEKPFELKSHMEALEAAVKTVKDVRLVVIDPISGFLGGADECKNAEVRQILSPLGLLAEKHRFAVIMVHHVNKGTGVKAMYRASGSLAFINAARVALFVVKDPDTVGRCFLAPVKCNIAPAPSAMAFTSEKQSIRFEATPIEGLSANSILARERTLLMDDDGGRDGKRGPIPAKIRACIERLVTLLEDGPQPQRTAAGAIEEAGFHPGTFYEAIARGPFEKFPRDNSNWLRLRFGEEMQIPPATNGHANGAVNGANGGVH